jgi:hypothetical protein
VKAARDLIRVVIKFTAGMEYGHDDLGSGSPFVFMVINGYPPAIICHTHGAVDMYGDVDLVTMTGEGFVYGVIDDLEHHVMQAGTVIGVTDVHSRALSHRVQALENLDVT